MSAVTSRPKDPTGAARQARYRERQKTKQQPITKGQWELLADVFIADLEGETPTRRQCATLAFNALLRCHHTGLVVELRDPSTR